MPLFAEQTTGFELNKSEELKSTGALSEAFDIGYETAFDPLHTTDHLIPPHKYDLYEGNQWPSHEILPGFQEIYSSYCSEALTLCRRLMRIFALTLGLEPEFFDSKIIYPGATSRMLHYPPQPVQGEVMEGMGAHTVGRHLSCLY